MTLLTPKHIETNILTELGVRHQSSDHVPVGHTVLLIVLGEHQGGATGPQHLGDGGRPGAVQDESAVEGADNIRLLKFIVGRQFLSLSSR